MTKHRKKEEEEELNTQIWFFDLIHKTLLSRCQKFYCLLLLLLMVCVTEKSSTRCPLLYFRKHDVIFMKLPVSSKNYFGFCCLKCPEAEWHQTKQILW